MSFYSLSSDSFIPTHIILLLKTFIKFSAIVDNINNYSYSLLIILGTIKI